MNTQEEQRNHLLCFLYDLHSKATKMESLEIGIQDLQRAMKELHRMTQQEVVSNLDYMAQMGLVMSVVKDRSFTTDTGVRISRTQTTFKISSIGINHIEVEIMLQKPGATSPVDIANIPDLTLVEDGTVVNVEFTDLYGALPDLIKAIAHSSDLSDEQKLNASGDLSTIRSQIAKTNPDRIIIQKAWNSIRAIDGPLTVAEKVEEVNSLFFVNSYMPTCLQFLSPAKKTS